MPTAGSVRGTGICLDGSRGRACVHVCVHVSVRWGRGSQEVGLLAGGGQVYLTRYMKLVAQLSAHLCKKTKRCRCLSRALSGC